MAKILIIGGTRFMGYFATETALARGHEVTLFNRGQSTPGAFPEAEHIRGDRDADIELLRGRQWDAVIDTCGVFPRLVRKSTELLAGSVQHYTFISTISVYDEIPAEGPNEDSRLATLEDMTVEEVRGDTYGGLKALCEQVVQEVIPGRSLIVRPTLIVGPRDPTDRFNYWVRRVAQGGEVLAPADPDRPVQFIDARDLAAWVVDMTEQHGTGIFNGVGPSEALKMGDFLDASRRALNSDARFTWVDEPFLLDREVAPWSELPIWVPQEMSSLHLTSNKRALAAGLKVRTIEETVRDTYEWIQANPERGKPQGSMTREREEELLREWHTSRQEEAVLAP